MSSTADRAIRVAVLAIAAGALLAGCAEAPLPSAPASTNSATVPGSYASQRPTPAPLLDEDRTKGLESTPWQLVRIEGRDVTIRFVAGGGCSSFEGVRVQQTARHVEIWTAVRTDHGAQACAAYLATGATTLHLSAPLGRRDLLHAPVSSDWQQYIDDF